MSNMSLLARSEDLPRPDCSTKIILSAGREEVARTPLAYLLSFCFRNNGSLDSGSYLGGFSLTKISKAMSVAKPWAISNRTWVWAVVCWYRVVGGAFTVSRLVMSLVPVASMTKS